MQASDVFLKNLSLKERFYLPRPVYEKLKSIYLKSGLKKCQEKYTLSNLPGENILLIQSGIGETFLLANYFISNGLKLPFDKIYVFRQSALQLLKLYFPEADISAYSGRILRNIEKSAYVFGKKRISYFLGQDFWRNFAKGTTHITKALDDFWNIKVSNLETPNLEKSYEMARIVMERNQLQKGKFIFLNSSSNSTMPLGNDDLSLLLSELGRAGYQIYHNNKENEKMTDLATTLAIASFSAAIISIRTGFTEVLAALGKKMQVFYTPGTLLNFQEHFTLHKYPYKEAKIKEWKYMGVPTIKSMVREIDGAAYE